MREWASSSGGLISRTANSACNPVAMDPASVIPSARGILRGAAPGLFGYHPVESPRHVKHDDIASDYHDAMQSLMASL